MDNSKILTGHMNEYGSSFIGGFLFSALGNVSWIWSMQILQNLPNNAASFALAFALKIIGTFILGIIGGIAGVLVREAHIYYKLRKKLKKK